MAPPAMATAVTASAPDIEDLGSDFGSVVVTQKCTGCVVCRVLAPDVFLEAHAGSPDPTVFTEVGRPLRSEAEFHDVRRAVMACPVGAIKWVKRPKLQARPLQEGYPKHLEGGVYAAGVPSKKLFGGMGYLIRGDAATGMQGRNILIDSPDAEPALVEAIRAMGGLEYIVFTHRDHIGCHAEWHAAFPGARRVLHEADMVMVNDGHGDTSGFEVVLSGPQETWTLPGWEAQRLTLLLLPGHTPGSIFIQYQERFLFTGDSLHYSRVDGRLTGFRLHCWQDWALQVASWRKLRERKFSYVLPGHGEPHRFASPDEAQQSLEGCIEWARALAPGHTPMWRFRLWAAARVASKSPLLKRLADRFALGASRQGLPAFAPPPPAHGGKKGRGEPVETWGFVAVSSPRALAVAGAVLAAVVAVGVAAAMGGMGPQGRSSAQGRGQ